MKYPFKKGRKFMTLPLRLRWLTAEACLELTVGGLFLRLLSFERITRIYANPESAPSLHNDKLPWEVKTALRYAGHLLPWKSKCLVRALAARKMLARRKFPSTLSLGVLRPGNHKTAAHAWLTADNLEVVEKNGEWTELFSF